MSHSHSSTQKLVNDLLAKFRTLVVEIEEENKELNQKLKQLDLKKSRLFSISSSSSSATTNPLTIGTITSSGGANSSPRTSTTTNASTIKPPPYKSAVKYPSEEQSCINNNNNNYNNNNNNLNNTHNNKNNLHIRLELPPDPPIRRRRRSNTYLLSSLTNRFGDMNIMAHRGALIVLEGLDRVGKSTLAKKLVEHLENVKKPVAHFRFPDRTTPIGQLIDNLLKDSSKKIDNHAMHLLFSANRWELDKQIRQTILNGTTVILDRYSYSGIAYSCAKGDLDINWCREVEKGLPKPDLVIYLELKKEFLYKRPGFGDERFEVEEFQELIRREYDLLIKSNKDPWLRINVENKGPEQVLGEVILPVKRCLESCQSKPLGSLDF